MKADQLGLRGTALQAARDYEARYPDVVFTSGRRSLQDQARAMAQNVVVNRQWIGQTYKAAGKLQAWVDAHPEAKSHASTEAGLLSVLQGMTDDERARVSCHLSGDAFDVKPDNDKGKDDYLKSLAVQYGGKYLDTEGGLRRRHWQARP